MTKGPFDLTGRIALVTGCGSPQGIGFASARSLGQLGASIAITSTTDRVETRGTELRAEGWLVTAHTADLTRPEEATALVKLVEAEHGRIDILVNAAGIAQTGLSPPSARFADLTPHEWAREIAVNLNTAVYASQAVLPGMQARGHGRIVMISSVTGPLVAAPRQAGYAAAKAAADGLMRSIALEYGRSGITANSVAPGWIKTASSTPDEIVARQPHAGRPPRHPRRGRSHRRVPRVRRGQLRDRTVSRGRRRQHDPGTARDRAVRGLPPALKIATTQPARSRDRAPSCP